MMEIGDLIKGATLYGVRSENPRHVRLFVIRDGRLDEVTTYIARLTRHRMTKKGWIIVRGYNHNPVQHLADSWAALDKKKNHPYEDMK